MASASINGDTAMKCVGIQCGRGLKRGGCYVWECDRLVLSHHTQGLSIHKWRHCKGKRARQEPAEEEMVFISLCVSVSLSLSLSLSLCVCVCVGVGVGVCGCMMRTYVCMYVCMCVCV